MDIIDVVFDLGFISQRMIRLGNDTFFPHLVVP